ncbi:MAG: Clp protease N-terminal domain-containing protein [Aggregatilineales bacterium]
MVNNSRYSHHARRALKHADDLAAQYRHPTVDTGHLLVGVMLTEGSIGCDVLHSLNLTASRALPFLPSLFSQSTDDASDHSSSAGALDQALALAADESVWLEQPYIGTEHLLLGLTRTSAGSAGLLLKRLESSAERLRREVRRRLRQGVAAEFSLQVARRTARLSELSRRVIANAEQLAVTLDHPTVGIGHLLLALLLEERGPMAALLRASGLDQSCLRACLDKRDPLPLESVELVLAQAQDHADNMGSHYTGTEHLLLALALAPAGAGLLRVCGADLAALVSELARRSQ